MLFSQFPEFHLRHLAASTERTAESSRRIARARDRKRRARNTRRSSD